MRYCFKRRERVAKGVERIARDQLDRALRELRGKSSDAAIHRARKRLKVVRAVLRLVRPELTPAVFDRENTAFRDIGRRLSVVPGLTGLWQANGWGSLSFDEGVRLDLEYIERRSLALDLRLILQTLVQIVRGRQF